jgi:hypothetical protein
MPLSRLLSLVLCVIPSVSAQAVAICATEMPFGSQVRISDPNVGVIRPMREPLGIEMTLVIVEPVGFINSKLPGHAHNLLGYLEDLSLCLLGPVHSQLFHQIGIRGPPRMRRVIAYQLRNRILLSWNCAIQSGSIQALGRHEPRCIVREPHCHSANSINAFGDCSLAALTFEISARGWLIDEE